MIIIQEMKMLARFKILIIGSAVAFLSISSISSADARTCRVPDVTPEVTFDITPYKVAFKKGASRGDPQRITRRHSITRRGGKWFPLGVTLTTFSYEVSPKVMAYPMKGGRYCAVPTEIRIKMGYPKFEILIDRRYRRGTCQFNAIRDHENEHVDLYLDTLDRMTPWLESRILGEVNRIKPITETSPDRAAKYFTRILMNTIGAAAKKLSTKAARANARIDTAQSYKLIQSQCARW